MKQVAMMVRGSGVHGFVIKKAQHLKFAHLVEAIHKAARPAVCRGPGVQTVGGGERGGSAAPGSASAARSGFHAAAASPALAAGSGAAASGSGSSAAPGPHTAAAWLAAAAAEIAPHPLDELD